MQKDPGVLFVDQSGNVWAPGIDGLTMAQTSADNEPLSFPLRRYAYTGDVDMSSDDEHQHEWREVSWDFGVCFEWECRICREVVELARPGL